MRFITRDQSSRQGRPFDRQHAAQCIKTNRREVTALGSLKPSVFLAHLIRNLLVNYLLMRLRHLRDQIRILFIDFGFGNSLN